MALVKEKIEIVFESLAQKTSSLAKPPGKMVSVINMEYDKTGILNKARGFIDMPVSSQYDVGPGLTTNFHTTNVTSWKNELILFGNQSLVSVLTVFEGDGLRTCVSRGPLPRGNCAKRKVVVASAGNQLGGAAP